MKDNIIKFRKKSKISDSEINGLFLGLVKLIKKVALEDASNLTNFEMQELNDELQKNYSIFCGRLQCTSADFSRARFDFFCAETGQLRRRGL